MVLGSIVDTLDLPPFSQICLVVEDLRKAASKLQMFGLGPFVFPEIHYTDVMYYGNPSSGYWEMAFSRWGMTELELACPVREPSIYQDFLKENGEGFHHFGFDVRNLDAYIEKAERLGYSVMMTGRTSSGGFAHLDTRGICGIILEVIERKAPRA
jgi:hypothetical protein